MLMRSNQDDDAIDAVIAEAARSLTAADPPPTLRVAVRDRIERPAFGASVFLGPPKLGTSEGGRRKKAWWLVPAGATVALVVVALVLGRPATPPTPVVQPGSDAPAVVAAPVVTVPVTTPETTSERRVAATLEPTPEELEPLIPPITIPLLETKQIAVDTSSGVMPIEFMPLRIEPLQGE